MIVCHGSVHIVKKPMYGKGKPNNDYGRGFYCTQSIELAKEWACGENKDGICNIYNLNTENLKVINLNSEEFNILNWIAVLTKYRIYWESSVLSEQAKQYLRDNFMIDFDSYDVIRGYRADNSFFSYVRGFVSNAISLQQLSTAIRIGDLGEQIVLRSEKAFENVEFIKSELVLKSEYFMKKEARDRYKECSNKKYNANDIFILDIMREGIKNGDSRISL